MVIIEKPWSSFQLHAQKKKYICCQISVNTQNQENPQDPINERRLLVITTKKLDQKGSQPKINK